MKKKKIFSILMIMCFFNIRIMAVPIEIKDFNSDKVIYVIDTDLKEVRKGERVWKIEDYVTGTIHKPLNGKRIINPYKGKFTLCELLNSGHYSYEILGHSSEEFDGMDPNPGQICLNYLSKTLSCICSCGCSLLNEPCYIKYLFSAQYSDKEKSSDIFKVEFANPILVTEFYGDSQFPHEVEPSNRNEILENKFYDAYFLIDKYKGELEFKPSLMPKMAEKYSEIEYKDFFRRVDMAKCGLTLKDFNREFKYALENNQNYNELKYECNCIKIIKWQPVVELTPTFLSALLSIAVDYSSVMENFAEFQRIVKESLKYKTPLSVEEFKREQKSHNKNENIRRAGDLKSEARMELIKEAEQEEKRRYPKGVPNGVVRIRPDLSPSSIERRAALIAVKKGLIYSNGKAYLPNELREHEQETEISDESY